MGGVRRLTVLKQFEPFGLTVEASDNGDGKPLEGDYKYSLFDSQLIRSNEDIISASCNDCDHELFIRGKQGFKQHTECNESQELSAKSLEVHLGGPRFYHWAIHSL